MGNNKEENILDTNNVCLESYNSICNLYNDETTRKIHFNRLLSFDEFKSFLYDYYNSDEKVSSVLLRYGFNEKFRSIEKYLPKFYSDSYCKHCLSKDNKDIQMFYTSNSRKSFKNKFEMNDICCPVCNHKIYFHDIVLCFCSSCKEEREEERAREDSLKLNKLEELIDLMESNKKDVSYFKTLSLELKTYMTTFLYYLYIQENIGANKIPLFNKISSLKKIEIAPTKELSSSMIHKLIDFDIVKFRLTQNNLDNIKFHETDSNSISYSYNQFNIDLELNINKDETFNFTNLTKECETIYAKNEDEKKEILETALELWKKIALEELKEYTYHLFEKYNFKTSDISDSLIEKLELILEDFSVSQGYAILYSSISGAASYKQTGISSKHAVNSIGTYIANNIAKRKSGEWEVKGYKRNYALPQTAVSIVFFHNILKIGERGFDKVPSIKNISDGFINISQETEENCTLLEHFELLKYVALALNKKDELEEDIKNLISKYYDEYKQQNEEEETL